MQGLVRVSSTFLFRECDVTEFTFTVKGNARDFVYGLLGIFASCKWIEIWLYRDCSIDRDLVYSSEDGFTSFFDTVA